jgi:hypothetical protein
MSWKEGEIDGVKTFWNGFHEIQGFILSHLWVPL